MSKLFISYRREDTADVCGRIDDKLAARFGRANVFKDVDSIPLGADFRAILREKVNECAAMLVVIGRHWVDVTDAAGRHRLESPNDFVRIEVEAALARGIPVIPVLVQGATIPREDQLPQTLAALAYRHGTDVRGDPHFHRDVDQLMERLAGLLAPAQSPTAPAASPAPSVRARPVPPATPPAVSPAPAANPAILPPRLAQLGFAAYRNGTTDYIMPPVVTVPAGEFLMGSDPKRDKGAYDDERPQHRLNLPAFQIGKSPVTVAEYACFVRAGHAEPKNTYGDLDWKAQLQRLDHPAVFVSWHDAMAYAAWLAKLTGQRWRLPTEAEWEKAARGSDGRIYPWGDAFDATRCNTYEGGKGTTTPVGSYPNGASRYGAQDMAGNVWEWTSSLFKSYPYTPNDGRENVNDTGNRVLRGGSWNGTPGDARAACRLGLQPDYLSVINGFRLVVAVPNS